MRPKTTEARPRGPNQPTKATVARSSPVPARAMATGTMRRTVRASTANTTSRQPDALEARDEHDGSEDEPDQQREEGARFLGEAQWASSSWWSRVPKAMPATKAAMKPFVPATDRARVGEQRQGQDGEGPDARRAPAVAAGQAQEDGTDDTRPRSRGRPRRAARPPPWLRWVPLTASAVAAPAMKRLTKGVAMPSLSPLSTLISRRTPEGTRSSAMMDAPRAASVGATMAPMAAATQSPLPAEEERGGRGAGPDGEGEADAEEACRERGVRPQGPHVDPGGVGEEHEGQRHLGQRADGRGVQVEVDDGRRAVGDDHAEHDEGDRGRDVPALEARRDEAPDDDACRDDGEGGDVEVVVHGPGAIVEGVIAPGQGRKSRRGHRIAPRRSSGRAAKG